MLVIVMNCSLITITSNFKLTLYSFIVIKQTRFFSGLFHIFNQPFTISGYSSYHSAWQ